MPTEAMLTTGIPTQFAVTVMLPTIINDFNRDANNINPDLMPKILKSEQTTMFGTVFIQMKIERYSYIISMVSMCKL